jgi:hypothetical protein
MKIIRAFTVWRIKYVRKHFAASEPKSVIDARSNAEYLMDEYTPRELTGYMKVLKTNMERIRQEKIARAKMSLEKASDALAELEGIVL